MNEPQLPKIHFPVYNYPIKIIGENKQGFYLQEYVIECVLRHLPTWQADRLNIRRSTKGNYLAVSIFCDMDTPNQLKTLVDDLKNHYAVRMVL